MPSQNFKALWNDPLGYIYNQDNGILNSLGIMLSNQLQMFKTEASR